MYRSDTSERYVLARRGASHLQPDPLRLRRPGTRSSAQVSATWNVTSDGRTVGSGRRRAPRPECHAPERRTAADTGGRCRPAASAQRRLPSRSGGIADPLVQVVAGETREPGSKPGPGLGHASAKVWITSRRTRRPGCQTSSNNLVHTGRALVGPPLKVRNGMRGLPVHERPFAAEHSLRRAVMALRHRAYYRAERRRRVRNAASRMATVRSNVGRPTGVDVMAEAGPVPFSLPGAQWPADGPAAARRMGGRPLA